MAKNAPDFHEPPQEVFPTWGKLINF